MYLAYSDTLRMKIPLFKIKNVLHITFVHISSVYLYIFISLPIKSKTKNLIFSVKL